MSQQIELSDSLKSLSVTVTLDSPVLNVTESVLKAIFDRISELDDVDPLDTVLFETIVDPPNTHHLVITFDDAKTITYVFSNVLSSSQEYSIETSDNVPDSTFSKAASIKNAILALNDTYGSSPVLWESTEMV